MILQWHKTDVSFSFPGSSINSYVFGPCIRIEQIDHAKYKQAKNYFLFNNKRFVNETDLIKAVDKAAKK